MARGKSHVAIRVSKDLITSQTGEYTEKIERIVKWHGSEISAALAIRLAINHYIDCQILGLERPKEGPKDDE